MPALSVLSQIKLAFNDDLYRLHGVSVPPALSWQSLARRTSCSRPRCIFCGQCVVVKVAGQKYHEDDAVVLPARGSGKDGLDITESSENSCENLNLLQLRPISLWRIVHFKSDVFNGVYTCRLLSNLQTCRRQTDRQCHSVCRCVLAFAASKSIDPASNNSKANIGLESTPARCLPAVVSCCN